MRTIAKLALTSIGLTAAACSTPGPAPENLEQRNDPIIYGELDYTHQAVVMVSSGSGLCSGTIIEVNGSYGYVLTAAHCVTNPGPTAIPAYQFTVYQGNNYNNPSDAFNVDDVAFHPLWDGDPNSANDFGMLRITGASGAPTIPAMTPAQDNLAAGNQLDLIGYGRTESGGTNTRRRHIVKSIDGLTSAWLQWNQTGTSGGVCSGDSGGPALTTTGTERVAAVHSGVSAASCVGYAASGRVSVVYDSFIKPFIDGTTGVITCDECDNAVTSGNGACVATMNACANSQACNDFYNCIAGCSDAACQNQCIQNNQTGADLYFAIGDCICNNCSECANDPMCQTEGCGWSISDASCNDCNEASCCNEALACADDAACVDCATSTNPPASCSSNAAKNAWDSCLAQHCSTECGLVTSGCGLTTGDQACDDCFQTACLTECETATGDADLGACLDCYNGCSDQACMDGCDTQYPSASAALGALDTCMGGNCATECGMGGSGGAGGTGGTGGVAGSGGATGGSGGATGGSAGTAGVGGTGPAGSGGGTGAVGGSAGSAGMGGSAGAVGGSAGTAGTPGTGGGVTATPTSDTSGDSGGCSTSPANGKNSAGALALIGLALAFLRRRR